MLESWFFAKENEGVNEKSAKECNGNELLEGGKSGCKIQLNTLVEESKKNAVSGVNFKFFKVYFQKKLSKGNCWGFARFKWKYSCQPRVAGFIALKQKQRKLKEC